MRRSLRGCLAAACVGLAIVGGLMVEGATRSADAAVDCSYLQVLRVDFGSLVVGEPATGPAKGYDWVVEGTYPGPFTWTLTGKLPLDLKFAQGGPNNNNAWVWGTPLEPGKFPVTVQVTDNSTGCVASTNDTIVISALDPSPTNEITVITGVSPGDAESCPADLIDGTTGYNLLPEPRGFECPVRPIALGNLIPIPTTGIQAVDCLLDLLDPGTACTP